MILGLVEPSRWNLSGRQPRQNDRLRRARPRGLGRSTRCHREDCKPLGRLVSSCWYIDCVLCNSEHYLWYGLLPIRPAHPVRPREPVQLHCLASRPALPQKSPRPCHPECSEGSGVVGPPLRRRSPPQILRPPGLRMTGLGQKLPCADPLEKHPGDSNLGIYLVGLKEFLRA